VVLLRRLIHRGGHHFFLHLGCLSGIGLEDEPDATMGAHTIGLEEPDIMGVRHSDSWLMVVLFPSAVVDEQPRLFLILRRLSVPFSFWTGDTGSAGLL
jgi:hypothetical protein